MEANQPVRKGSMRERMQQWMDSGQPFWLWEKSGYSYFCRVVEVGDDYIEIERSLGLGSQDYARQGIAMDQISSWQQEAPGHQRAVLEGLFKGPSGEKTA